MFKLVLLASLAATAAAQVSPAHFATWEGDLFNIYPFSYSTTAPNWLRLQQIHEDLMGPPVPITKLTFRREGSINGTPAGNVPVRSITMVLTMAPSVAIAAATTSFAGNVSGASTTVFSGPVSTPLPWATPAMKSPTDFDFPIVFTTPFVYLGSGAFLWDLGVLSMSSTVERVYLDHAQSGFSLFANSAYQMYGSGCTSPNGKMELRAYGQTLGAPIQAITWGVTTTAAPASTPAAWLIGSQQINQPLQGLCTNVYTNPLVTVAGTTDATGTWQVYFQTPQNPVFFATSLTMQTAAADATQPFFLPVAASNGLVYRAAPMQPTFAVAIVRGLNGNATGSLLTGQATVVKFN